MKPQPAAGMTRNLLIAISICVVNTSFQTGYNSAIINAPEEVIKQFIRHAIGDGSGSDVTDAYLATLYGVMVSMFSAGSIVGGVMAGFLSNKYGRKKAIMLGSVLAMVGSSLQFGSRYTCSFHLLVIGRFLTGINTGIISVAVPLFSSEIAPVRLRGLCVTMSQFSMSFGTTLSLVIGNRNVLGTETNWQYAIGMSMVPAVIVLLTFYWIPESPRYLVLTKNMAEAVAALKWFRGGVYDADELVDEEESQKDDQKYTLCSLLSSPVLRRTLMLSVMVILSKQLSGVHVMLYYSTSLFISAGLTEDLAQYAAIGTSLVNIPMLLVSSMIVDRAGRRSLLLIGLSGMLVFSIGLSAGLILQDSYSALSYLCVASVFMYSISFSLGPAGIPKLLTTELFTQGPRATAVSLCVTVSRMSNLIVALTFPLLNTTLQSYSFLPFVGFLLLFIIYIFIKLPETKGKTYKEISALFAPSCRRQTVFTDKRIAIRITKFKPYTPQIYTVPL